MKRVLVLLVMALGLFVAVPVSVNAVENETETVTNTTNKVTTTATTATDGAATDVKKSVEERKARQKTTVDAREKAKISGQCVAAQAKAKAVLKKLNDNQQPYKTNYEKYSKRLADLQDKLKASGVDTNSVNSSITALNDKYNLYLTSLSELNAAMTDITTMDCKSDPAGFKAVLADARLQIKATNDARKEINTAAKEVIKSLRALKEKTSAE